MSRRLRLAMFWLTFLPGIASAAPAAEAPVSTFGALFQALMGLAVVLAVMYGFFWFLKRFSPGQTTGQGGVRVVGGAMLGTRERLVIVEVGEEWLLLGVTSNNVSHLHTMPKPAGGVEGGLTAPNFSPFSGKLAEMLNRRKQG